MDENKLNLKKKIVIWSIISLPLFFLIILFYNISVGNLGFMPSFEELENPKSNLATEVYSEDGEILGTFFTENRARTEYPELSPYLVDALVSTEDVRFYRHSGVDLKGLFRVLIKTIISRDKNSGGGSTISQQLAKMLFPRESFDNPIQIANRKFREWVIAIKLERSYTKEQIIAMYFNQFDFLNLAVGIKSASKVYFNCNPNELKIEEAAMLVGMAKNPSLFNPIRRPDTTMQRRNVVLWQMLNNNRITRNEFDSLKSIPLKLNYQKVDHKLGSATYFREFLRLTLNAQEPKRENYYSFESFVEDSIKWTNNPLYGWCNKNLKPDGSNYDIYKDGLRIYTTINSKLQIHAEEAVKEHLKNNLQVAFDIEKSRQKTAPFSEDLTPEEVETLMTLAMKRSERFRVLRKSKMPMDSITRIFNQKTEMTVFTWAGDRDTVMTPMDSIRHYKHFLQSGLMAMEPGSSYVRAYVGGINYSHFQFDHVTKAKRQIGSTFKPFLYTLAMQNGFSPCDMVPNVPVTVLLETGETWTPKGGGRTEWDRKMLSLRFGLAHSLNNISVWLMNQFKPKAVINMARNMGVTSSIPEVPSICLGVADLTLAEMVGAYTTYANKGVYADPVFVTRIEDKNGNILASFQTVKREAISENTAALMLELLQGVVRRGTSVRLWSDNYPYKIKAQIAAKTGTTQNQSDGWFIGITPKLVTGVWTGAEDRATHFDGITLGQGANMALPIWAIFMNKVYQDNDLNISESDIFELPYGFNAEFNCIDIADPNSNDNNKTNYDEEFMM